MELNTLFRGRREFLLIYRDFPVLRINGQMKEGLSYLFCGMQDCVLDQELSFNMHLNWWMYWIIQLGALESSC